MIVITSKIDGFRRAGIAHSSHPTPYADDRFTAAQLAQLKAEPNLVVQAGLPKAVNAKKPDKPTAVQVDAAQQALAAEADADALAREAAATKKAPDKKAWQAAEERARESESLSAEEWAGLAASDRVARIEQQIAQDGQP